MRTTIIAECGNNHEGSLDAALELLEKAKESGADLVKFQAGVARGFARNIGDVPKYKPYELGAKGYWRLIDRGLELKIPVFFSVWSDGEKETEEWIDGFRRIGHFKIAARQCTQRLINKHDLSTTYVSIPHNFVGTLKIKSAIPLHCVAEYPAQTPQLKRMQFLKQYFGRPVGYSDHTIGIKACVDAAKLGAVAIEKHFTLRHDFGPLRDHALSATPEELKQMVEEIKNGKS